MRFRTYHTPLSMDADLENAGGRVVASYPKTRFAIRSDATHHHLIDLKAADDQGEDDPHTLAERMEGWQRTRASVEPTKPMGQHDGARQGKSDRALIADGGAPMPTRLRALQRMNSQRLQRK